MRDVILIADDCEAIRRQLAGALSESFVVCEAADEKEAIRQIAASGNKLCAVLVDSLLPAGGAVSILKFMCATNQTGKFPVMFISSFNLENDEMKEFCTEIDDIIEKPFNIDIVKRRIKNIVELYNYRRNSSAN